MGHEAAATDTEGTVDWQAAEDFLTGKTAAAGDEGNESAAGDQETPEFVEVSIRGKKVRMSAEAAEAYEAVIQEQRARDGRLGGELQQLKERNARLEGQLEVFARQQKPAGEITPPDPKLAEEDFAEYHRRMIEYSDAKAQRARAEALDAIEELERTWSQSASNEDQAARWVNEFYSRHSHLNDDEIKDVVQAVYNKHAREIDGLRKAGLDHEAQDRLAELTDKKLVALRSRSKQANDNKPPRIEGRGTPPARTPAAKPAEEEFSAADWVRRKRALLRGDKKR